MNVCVKCLCHRDGRSPVSHPERHWHLAQPRRDRAHYNVSAREVLKGSKSEAMVPAKRRRVITCEATRGRSSEAEPAPSGALDEVTALAGASRPLFTNRALTPPHTVTAPCRKKWIKEIGSGGPVWSKGCDPALPPRERARDALFDVYEVSTMSCDVLRDS